MNSHDDLNNALYDVLKDLRQRGMSREASQVIASAERIAASGPELLNSNHITQVGRSELGLHGGQRTKMWEQFGPVLGWFRIQNGPARGVPVPQMMPGESMTSFINRSQQWLQNYAKISGQQEAVATMQRYFSMIQKPANMQQLEKINREIYQEFDKQVNIAQQKNQRNTQSPAQTPKK